MRRFVCSISERFTGQEYLQLRRFNPHVHTDLSLSLSLTHTTHTRTHTHTHTHTHTQDKIKAQSQAATQRPVDVRSEEFGALGRRTESLQAAKALLEDKLHLMKLSAHSAPRVDIDRIRADVEREVSAKLEADLQGRLRNLSESIRMESLQTIRSRDATIQVRRLLALLVQKYIY